MTNWTRKWDYVTFSIGGLGNSSLFFHEADPDGLIDALIDSAGFIKFFTSNVLAVNPAMSLISSLKWFCFLVLESSISDIGCDGDGGYIECEQLQINWTSLASPHCTAQGCLHEAVDCPQVYRSYQFQMRQRLRNVSAGPDIPFLMLLSKPSNLV